MSSGLSNAEVAEVYREYGHLLLRRCQVVLRDKSLGEDAFQEAIIKLMRYGAELHNAESELRWLYRVADRCCFDLLKKSRRVGELVDPPEPSTPHPAIQMEVRDAALRFLYRLNEKERTITVLAFVDGLSQEEIAKETGYSRRTVNKKLRAIRKHAERQIKGNNDV